MVKLTLLRLGAFLSLFRKGPKYPTTWGLRVSIAGIVTMALGR